MNVPAYRTEKCLPSCLEILLTRTYCNQIISIFDGESHNECNPVSDGLCDLFMRLGKTKSAYFLNLSCNDAAIMIHSLCLWHFCSKFSMKCFCFMREHFMWLPVNYALSKIPQDKQRVYFIATPQHGNLGDQAIVYAEHQVFERNGLSANVVEIPNSVYLKYCQRIQKIVNLNDLIVIDGGGNLGTLWETEDDKIADIILRFRDNRIIVFPQTCFYKGNLSWRLERNKQIYSTAPNLTLTFRDITSYNFAVKNFVGVRCEYVPDIVLSIKNAPNSKIRNNVLLCFRKDHEKIISDNAIDNIKEYLERCNIKYVETDTVIPRGVSEMSRNNALRSKWEEFSNAGLVITDRLHGMIFAVITGTPCIAVDNVSKKISGVHEWIKELTYIRVLEDSALILPNIPIMFSTTGFNYFFDYPAFFDKEIISWRI